MLTECTLHGKITVEVNLKGTIKQDESFYDCATKKDIISVFEQKENKDEEVNYN